VCNALVGLGFSEIFTNSITNSKYYSEEVLGSTIKMINNLSADLDVMRPSMLETGLETIAHNLNRRNLNLQLFEFGQTYTSTEVGKYTEDRHCALYITGQVHADHWKEKTVKADFYYLKAVVNSVLKALGLGNAKMAEYQHEDLYGLEVTIARQPMIKLGMVSAARLERFDIKQPVLFADLQWDLLVAQAKKQKTEFKEIPKFPAVQRDLALVVDKAVKYEALEDVAKKTKLSKMTGMQLFDVFESDKLGAGKKSMAVNFTFQDTEKTLTDGEIDKMVQQLVNQYETELGAVVRS
jgi:phenylalanyl-tRNA synthetase beta chain